MIFLALQLVLAIIFIIFSCCMLCDQYNSVNNDTTCKYFHLNFSNRCKGQENVRTGKKYNLKILFW